MGFKYPKRIINITLAILLIEGDFHLLNHNQHLKYFFNISCFFLMATNSFFSSEKRLEKIFYMIAVFVCLYFYLGSFLLMQKDAVEWNRNEELYRFSMTLNKGFNYLLVIDKDSFKKSDYYTSIKNNENKVILDVKMKKNHYPRNRFWLRYKCYGIPFGTVLCVD